VKNLMRLKCLRQQMMHASFVATSLIILCGCAIHPKPETPAPPSILERTSSEDKGRSYVVEKDNALLQVFPATRTVETIGTLENDVIPPGMNLNTFEISPSGSYIVWFHPNKGMLTYSLKTGSIDVLASPSSWFSAIPFYRFSKNDDLLYFVDNRGSVLHRINLETKGDQTFDIAQPVGSYFVLSPDEERLVHIPGFGIDTDYPEHWVTKLSDGTGIRFVTSSELADRYQISWRFDGSALFSIDNGNTIRAYPINDLESPISVGVFLDKGRFVQLSTIDALLFAETNTRDWFVYDQEKDVLTDTIPSSVTSGLSKATIIPYSAKLVLIEEVVQDFDLQFNRLWVSDFRGVRSILVPEYFRTALESD
jgi:hypothetical protein